MIIMKNNKNITFTYFINAIYNGQLQTVTEYITDQIYY